MKNLTIRLLAFGAFTTASGFAWAWAGAVQGQIGTFDVAPGNNYGLRISLKTVQPMCGGTTTWAYLNESDSNYKAYLSVLLAAKYAGSTVVIFSEKDATTEYCHIGYISVS